MSSYIKPSAYVNSEIAALGNINFSNRTSSFFDTVKQSPLFSKFALGELGNIVSGASQMSVSFGSYGNVNFDFATYDATYNYVKGFLLLLASYVAVRIVILRR
ncbi:MAG: hypothetical protein HY754_09175 [Nitrospirae bacterium]|nr:hypothetical protein [Nitrospirota bacterium]